MGATVEKVTLAHSVITEFDSLTSSISVPGGAHQLVQHRAHLGLRRHGGGVAGGGADVFWRVAVLETRAWLAGIASVPGTDGERGNEGRFRGLLTSTYASS